jgi:hypothetical protein
VSSKKLQSFTSRGFQVWAGLSRLRWSVLSGLSGSIRTRVHRLERSDAEFSWTVFHTLLRNSVMKTPPLSLQLLTVQHSTREQ